MPILVRNIRLGLDDPEDRIVGLVAKRLRVPVDKIRAYAIVRRSLDARRRGAPPCGTGFQPVENRFHKRATPQELIHFCYHVEVALDEPTKEERARLVQLGRVDAVWIEPGKPRPASRGLQTSGKARPTDCDSRPPDGTPKSKPPLPHRPIIIGFGPAGMFAALRLARYGYKPLVLERGRDIQRRHHDVLQRYFRERDFDPSSNLLFGEGGAGTYSDGKLYTRVSDPLCQLVLEVFFRHGADPDILINARPHVGSDRLGGICARIRGEIERLGGEIRFESQVDDIRIREDPTTGGAALTAVHVSTNPSRGLQPARLDPSRGLHPARTSAQSGSARHGLQTSGKARPTACGSASDDPAREDGWIPVGPTIVAVGHSARDTIRMLHRRGVLIESKPFQVGVRIEHPQAMVDRWQYGEAAGHQRLGPAEYHMVAKHAGGTGCDMFSFCMCPGGMILPTNESEGLIVTNGASRAQRLGPFANSGLVITVDPKDHGEGPLAGFDFQKRWERLAFRATGGTYRVPAQRASDFLDGCRSHGTLKTSFPLGSAWADIRMLIPEEVAAALGKALPMLDRKYPGFAGKEGVITAPETRGSAPVRVVRDPTTREAALTANLYPVGEGAGYAGGIVSAAVDGIKTADAIIRTYAPSGSHGL